MVLLKEDMSPSHNFVFSTDGRWLAADNENDFAMLWDMTKPNPSDYMFTLQGHDESVVSIDISPDNQWLATASLDGTVRIWDLNLPDPTTKDPIILDNHEDTVRALSFSQDGRWLAVGSDNYTARLWDVSILPNKPNYVSIQRKNQSSSTYDDYDLLITSDSQWLVVANGVVGELWNLNLYDTNEMINSACQTVGRNLTEVEWQVYFNDEQYRKTCPQWPEGQ
jgi:WD40 repeat protein